MTTTVPPVRPPSEWPYQAEDTNTQLLREINSKLGTIKSWVVFFGVLAVIAVVLGIVAFAVATQGSTGTTYQ